MIRDSWFAPGVLLLALYTVGCQTVPSREQWLTPAPKTPPPPVERVLGQALPFDDFSGPAVTPISPIPPSTPNLWGEPVVPVQYSLPPSPSSATYNPLPISESPAINDLWQVAAQPAINVQPVVTAEGTTGGYGANFPPPMDYWANAAASPSPVSVDDPWGDQHSRQREAVSLEAAAKAEEDAQERARQAELAAAKNDGRPGYLRPLPHPAGPLADRERKKNIEQDIIVQAGFNPVSKPHYDVGPLHDWEEDGKKAFDWGLLDPASFFTKVRDWIGMGPDERKANAAMKKGHEILNPYRERGELKDRKIWAAAAKEFWAAAKRWPDSVLEEDALHLAGECYYFAEDYPNALKCYQKLMIKYQHSKYFDADVRRVFSIAKYWELEARRGVAPVNLTEKSRPALDPFGYSKKAYETIFLNDPNGPMADEAVMSLAQAYLLRGRYQGDENFGQAAFYFNHLYENYPLSRHIAKAHELGTYAKSNSYMGPDYDPRPLAEANKLADVTLRQFRAELGEDDHDILAIKEGVVIRQAEMEWVYGQHYDKKKYYDAARLYYEKLVDKYPQTEYAEKARVRLGQIEGLPPQPSNFALLEKIFLPRGR